MYMVGPRNTGVPPPLNLSLCGQSLPWVSRCDHLGHTLTSDGKMTQDCKEKRAQLIDETVKIRETFGFAHSSDKIFAINKYCGSHYSSNLWDLKSGVLW